MWMNFSSNYFSLAMFNFCLSFFLAISLKLKNKEITHKISKQIVKNY